MKTKSKALLLALCAVLLVVASVLTTLAFLTATDKVDNVFTVGNVTLGIDEAKVNENGQPLKKDAQTDKDVVVTDKKDADRVQANTYKLQPGKTYVKDPTIHVASTSDPCFLFVKIENGLVQTIDGEPVDIEAASEAGGYQTIADQMSALGWKPVIDTTIVDGIYAYVGTAAATLPLQVAGGQDKTVFNEFKVSGDVDGVTLDQFKDKKITVTAYAVQASGFEGMTASQIITAAFPQLLVANQPVETSPEVTLPD